MSALAEDDEFIDACLARGETKTPPRPLGRRVRCRNCGHDPHSSGPCSDTGCVCRSSTHRGMS